MQKMNISENFINKVKLFKKKATTVVNFNGNPSNNFKVERGIRQGCPIAPYLFLIVGEVLTHTNKRAVQCITDFAPFCMQLHHLSLPLSM
jgi:hypothetical protein